MKYKLKILSPVHIGCGEQYNGLNFVLEGKYLYIIEPDAIFKLLGPKNAFKFAEWLEVKSNEITKIDQEYRIKKRENHRSDETRRLNNELREKKRLLAILSG